MEVAVAESDLGRAVLGVVDGMPPAGQNKTAKGEAARSPRTIGYKL